MSLKTYKFNTVDEMNRFLAGTVTGKPLNPPLVYGLVGKTAKFTAPATATCTFAVGTKDPTGGGLTFEEIQTQLQNAVSGLTVSWSGLQLTLSGGVTFASGSTGLAILGFSNAEGGGAVAYNAPDGSTPRLITAFGYGTQMAVIVEE